MEEEKAGDANQVTGEGLPGTVSTASVSSQGRKLAPEKGN